MRPRRGSATRGAAPARRARPVPCFEWVADRVDSRAGRTVTWDQAIELWGILQSVRSTDARLHHYEGLSHVGRSRCLGRRPLNSATRQVREGVNAFYDVTGINELMNGRMHVSTIPPRVVEALESAKMSFAEAERLARVRVPDVSRETDFARDFLRPQGLDDSDREQLRALAPLTTLVPRSFADVTAEVTQSVILLDTDTSQGTGTIIHPDGYVLTNAHVVDDTSRIEASMANGTRTALRIAAVDESADIALLWGDLVSSPPIALGNPTKVRIGDEIGVAGYPLGTALADDLSIYGNTPSVTKGVISAIRSENGHTVFQFDAEITSGYSGGPVFLADTGEMIGLATNEIVTIMGSTGIRFAVGINSARALWDANFARSSWALGPFEAPG